jgi:PAS domain-containing protein
MGRINVVKIGLINKYLEINAINPEEQRRGRLLNIFIFGLVPISALIIPAILIIGKIFSRGWQAYAPTLWASMIFIFGSFIIYWINRQGKVFLANILFIMLLVIAITVANIEAMGHGRTLFYFVIPILLASALIHPNAGMIFAILITAESIIIAIQLELVPEYYFTAIGLFAIAFVSWIYSSNLENALKELRVLNIELDHRVSRRTEELACANEILRAREKNLADAQRIAHIGSWEWDIIDDTKQWSEEAYRISGLSSEKFGGKQADFLKLVPQLDENVW